jgi:hypothetical protein
VKSTVVEAIADLRRPVEDISTAISEPAMREVERAIPTMA